MNILERFKEKKERFASMVAHVQTAKHVKRAEKLRGLRKERLRLQGMENVRQIEAKEKMEIRKLKQNTPLRKAIRSASNKLKVSSQKRQSPLSKSNDFFNKTNSNNVFNTSTPGNNVFTTQSKNDVFNFDKKKKR